MATTTRTLPIADLDFPTVTVCPPKGSHTALNYDLMKADDESLSDMDRESLKNYVTSIMIESSHQDFMRTMLATANPTNMDQIYKGFISIPRQNSDTGFEMRMWNYNGSLQTPWFEENYN